MTVKPIALKTSTHQGAIPQGTAVQEEGQLLGQLMKSLHLFAREIVSDPVFNPRNMPRQKQNVPLKAAQHKFPDRHITLDDFEVRELMTCTTDKLSHRKWTVRLAITSPHNLTATNIGKNSRNIKSLIHPLSTHSKGKDSEHQWPQKKAPNPGNLLHQNAAAALPQVTCRPSKK